MSKIITLNSDTPSVQYLCKKDKRLAKVISLVGPITYQLYDKSLIYPFLIHEIIEQMLSIKAAQKIYERLENLCNNVITPEKINTLTDEQLKSIGTSNSKIKYIQEVTKAVLNDTIDLDKLYLLPEDIVINELTKLHGIGSWTAKMFLIFALDRQDVLPYEDVAFLQGYKWVYKTTDISKESVIKKCKKWKPYSSIGARFLYRARDLGLTKKEFHLYK